MKTDKTCVRCEHSQRGYVHTWAGSSAEIFCTNEFAENHDPVTGQVEHQTCARMRKADSPCGPDGKLWVWKAEPTPAPRLPWLGARIWQKLRRGR